MTGIRRLSLATALTCALAGCGRGATDAPKADAATAAGGDRLRAAYDRGLDFLASRTTDGVVSVRGNPFTGVTAFCLLPRLARPGGMRDSDKPLVDRSLAYVARAVRPDGGVNDSPIATFETSVVAMALAASKRPEYAAEIRRAAAYIRSAQHTDPAAEAYGGVGGYRNDPRADTSITYYAMAGLGAAGVPATDPFFRHALVFLQRVQNRKANETPGEPAQWKHPKLGTIVRDDDGGAVAYPGSSKAGLADGAGGAKVLRSCGSMTYSLLHGYRMAGLDETDGRVRSAVDWISNHWALDRNPGVPDEPPERQKLDGLFYYYAAIAKTLPAMGIERLRTTDGREIDWRADLAAAVLAAQKPDGSWQSTNVQWSESVSVIATTYSLIALGACIR